MSKAHYRNQSSDGVWSEFLGDVYSGCAIGLGHFKWFLGNVAQTIWPSPGEAETTAHADLSSKGIEVMGVGYGRTGTYSLALALDELGFPTLHTQHLYEHKEIFDSLVKNMFLKSIQEDEVIMGRPDFDLLLKRGYVATMDLPFALYFNQIHEKWPDCKFILTVRENSDVWFKSWDVLTSSITKPTQYTSFILTHVKKLEQYMRWLFAVVNSDKTFLSHPWPLPPQNKERAVASYERHNELVRDSIPSSHLLEYNVRQGWEPLCTFLEIPEADCPSSHNIPFPKSNSARAVQWQSYSSLLVVWIIPLFVMFSVFSLVFRQVMGISLVDWCCYQKARLISMLGNKFERKSK